MNYRSVGEAGELLMTGDKEAIIPIFEEFLTLFQKRTPAVHLVYDVMCQTLTTLMRRFLK